MFDGLTWFGGLTQLIQIFFFFFIGFFLSISSLNIVINYN
jgi:hypothetical protein